MKSIPLYLSGEHPCSYLDKQTAQSAFVHPHFQLTPSSYRILLEHGFRRSGGHVYSPHCSTCNACIPVRVPVAKFKTNRAQKRTWNKHQDTQVILKPPVFDPQHYDLYLKYQQSRHPDGPMSESSREDYMDFLTSHWCDTQFIEFHRDQQLIAVAIIDCLDNAWSAVYTFFDPDYSTFSPGVYAVLWEIEQAKNLNLSWLYLGYWIKDCRKMAYKSQYRPLEMFREQRWSLVP